MILCIDNEISVCRKTVLHFSRAPSLLILIRQATVLSDGAIYTRDVSLGTGVGLDHIHVLTCNLVGRQLDS